MKSAHTYTPHTHTYMCARKNRRSIRNMVCTGSILILGGMHEQRWIYTYIHTYVCMYVCMYVCTYILYVCTSSSGMVLVVSHWVLSEILTHMVHMDTH